MGIGKMVTPTGYLCPECGAEVAHEQDLGYPYFSFYVCPKCSYRRNTEGFRNFGVNKYPPKKPAWMIKRDSTCPECGQVVCPKCHHHAEAASEGPIDGGGLTWTSTSAGIAGV